MNNTTQLLTQKTFSSQARELCAIRELIREIMAQQGCSEQESKDAALAINEACMNIIQHTYAGKDDGKIIIEIYKTPTEVVFKLTDFGPPVDIEKCKSRDLNNIRPGGLGIHLIKSVMDEMQFLQTNTTLGNVLELKKRIA